MVVWKVFERMEVVVWLRKKIREREREKVYMEGGKEEDNGGDDEWFDDGGEKDDVWRWACDEEMKEVECHVTVMDHVVHCTLTI